MKPRLGPLPSLIVSAVVALLGLAVTAYTLYGQHMLDTQGVSGVVRVVHVHYGGGRAHVDTIDVRLPNYPDEVNLDRFAGFPRVGDDLRVVYDPSDPTIMVQAGMSPWGAFQILVVGLGVAGAVCVPLEWRRLRRRRRRGGVALPKVATADGSRSTWSWAAKNPRRQRK